ncbi:hypothetical protein ZWY2020_009866 [Hordeum vulgare]|nr:hypothetical protein ZWY2020_009866 [Hordeum vulgare]
MQNVITLPITQASLKPPSLYVLDLSPTANTSSCLEVLSNRRNPSKKAPNLYSYAVVDGSTICISSPEKAIGTYTFDTVNEKWSQAAHRALPFFGRAEYVPELDFWFGLSLSACNPFSSLCAFDLSAIVSGQPPKVHHTEEPWTPSQLHLFSLGSGKFCVATLFGTALRTCDYEDTFGRECAVLTGLEVKRRNDDEGPLQFIKHMSKRFSVGSHNIECVL